MGEPQSSEVFFEIEGLISDALQVISYKWLSRKFSVPSNIAKRLLERFVTQNPQLDLEVVYAVSGWTKTDPRAYSIQLVPKIKLEGAKRLLSKNSSVHVYSVQRSLPKDPAQLWTADFVQSMELFNQPHDVSNCLRDNRFSAVACGSVQRSVVQRTTGSASASLDSKPAAGTHANLTRPAQSAAGPSLISKPQNFALKQVQTEVINPVSAAQVHLPTTHADVKPVKKEPAVEVKPKTVSPPGSKRKADNSGVSAGAGEGTSFSNLWGKAASKPKISSPPKAPEASTSPVTGGDAEARIEAAVADICDEDADRYPTGKRRKSVGRRRMVVDDDDDAAEEDGEMVVRLATPGSPQDVKPPAFKKSNGSSECNPKHPVNESTVPSVLQERNTAAGVIHPPLPVKKETLDAQVHGLAGETDAKRTGPRRKKVLHTKIDEKGREVTEVVWVTEGEEINSNNEKFQPAVEKASDISDKERDRKTSIDRPRSAPKAQPVQTKAPPPKASKVAGRIAMKQQGSIMSFFKKQ